MWNVEDSSLDNGTAVWRKLPIHEACIQNAPIEIICTLVNAYSEGVRSVDSFGRLPLHHACFHGASQDTLEVLLNAYPHAVDVQDIWGFIPCITDSIDENMEVDGISTPKKDKKYISDAIEVELKKIH